ncbi:MAG TPA: hypothetical protein VFQ78_05235 [Candidatus Udaeobacter sp.]|jgi:hypothetical protein|nr:hypothetical protein [Candidatus Udaeobacter sp.]
MDLDSVYQSIGRVPTYRWGFYKNPDYMRALRERACTIFFNGFQIHPACYVAGQLPRLPFADCEFDLTLISYLLFASKIGSTTSFTAIPSWKSCV